MSANLELDTEDIAVALDPFLEEEVSFRVASRIRAYTNRIKGLQGTKEVVLGITEPELVVSPVLKNLQLYILQRLTPEECDLYETYKYKRLHLPLPSGVVFSKEDDERMHLRTTGGLSLLNRDGNDGVIIYNDVIPKADILDHLHGEELVDLFSKIKRGFSSEEMKYVCTLFEPEVNFG